MWVATIYSAYSCFVALTTSIIARGAPRQLSNSLALVQGEASFTFSYSTGSPSGSNWIGVYVPGSGPRDGQSVSPSAAWDWAPDAKGTVFIPTSSLTPGSYEAYLLADGGYEVIGEKIEVQLARRPGPLSFFVGEATLKNGREGDEYEADLSGLLAGGGDSPVTYAVNATENGDWVSISSSGVLTGTPSTSGTTNVTVLATVNDSDLAQLTLTIPVVSTDEPLVKELSILSWNLWYGGSSVSNYHAKQVSFLLGGDFDIVVMQEATGGHATRLGKALGWYSFQGSSSSVGIISRYPIAEVYDEQGHGGAVRIALDGEDSQLNVWGVHLGYTPYGPYDFCFSGMTVDQVLVREDQSKRGPQIRETVSLMAEQLANTDNIPVILAGDFNAPSHLDWIDETSDAHCGAGYVPWPTSVVPTKAGLVDAFRVANPDPAAVPGITWSPIYLTNNGRPEPLDRIDVVYHKGGFEVLSSEVLIAGKPKPQPNHKENEWTSDHASVVARFKI